MKYFKLILWVGIMNRYVDFIDDEIFLNEVKKVFDAYNDNENKFKNKEDLLFESKNEIDFIKFIFDISSSSDISFNSWASFEIRRQDDKTVTNKIGEFHQGILGSTEGWIDLGKGDETAADLKNEDETIFIELKNKYNTLNNDGKKVHILN